MRQRCVVGIAGMKKAFVLGPVVALALVGVARVAPPTDKSWAYCTPVRPALPVVRDRAWVRNPIDAFILARLEGEAPAALRGSRPRARCSAGSRST